MKPLNVAYGWKIQFLFTYKNQQPKNWELIAKKNVYSTFYDLIWYKKISTLLLHFSQKKALLKIRN